MNEKVFSAFVDSSVLQQANTGGVGKVYSDADIPVVDGKIYHLSIQTEFLSPNIILAGDPDRVPLLADHCLKKGGRIDVFHRGLRTVAGTAENGLPVTIATTGMGAPSVEIILNELVILNEIDLQTRARRKTPIHKTLNIIRLGTSAALQPSTELGSLVITEYAIGMDNTGLFYDAHNKDVKVVRLEKSCKEKIDKAIDKKARFWKKIHPYAAAASPEIVNALYEAALKEQARAIKGITVSNSGFFANQGRDVSRLKITIPNIDRVMAEISIDDLKAENMEMEASFICHFAGSLGYRAGAICPVICNRYYNTFYKGSYDDRILEALGITMKAFEKLN
jgi:uridine phosphorylase